MKTILRRTLARLIPTLFLITAHGLTSAVVRAQLTDVLAKSSANKLDVVLPTAENPQPAAASLNLKHNEVLRTFDVVVQSDDDRPTTVFGVQTTSGLYVVDFPKVLSPKAKSTVTLIYLAKQNSSGSADVLTLLTDRGEKTVQIDHGREPAVLFDRTSLSWQVGEAATAKTVTLTMLPNSAVPKSVRVMGSGQTAQVTSLGGDRYQITVTPGSTAKPQQFPVFIQFVPSMPGLNTMISCSVVSKE